LKLKIKIGVVGALAVTLVALSVFGFRHGSSTDAAVTAGNVWLVGGIPRVSTTSADCSTQPGARQVNTFNFPPSPSSIFFNTGTTTASPTGLPMVEIQNLSAATSVLDTTNQLFVAQNFILICVNPTALNNAAILGAGGTILYPSGAAGIPLNDGPITFSAITQSNMGFFGRGPAIASQSAFTPTCDDKNANGQFGEITSDACLNTAGEGTAQLTIPADVNNLDQVIVPFTCVLNPLLTTLVMPITIQQNQGSFTFNVICKGQASGANTTLSATPNTVEIIPARSNTSHSLILLKILSANGTPIFPGTDVEFRVLPTSTAKCSIETAGLGTGTSAITDIFGNIVRNVPSLGTLGDTPNVLSIGSAIVLTSQLNTAAPGTFLTWEFSGPAQTPIDVLGGFAPFGTNAFDPSTDITKAVDGFDLNGDGVPDNSLAAAVLSCNPLQAPGVTPGVANIQACVAVLNAIDVCATATVKVVGPPASITVAASPTSVNCGEKATVTANVVDAIGQPVSDHTRVELVTNLGGVLGGTGAVAGFAANVAPVSSSVADTFGGVATAFLLTSDVTTGPYEVVATSGGTTSGDFGVTGNSGLFGLNGFVPGGTAGFSLAPQFSSQFGTFPFPFSLPTNVLVNAAGTPVVNGTPVALSSIQTPISSLGTSALDIFGNQFANVSGGPISVFPTQTFLGGQFSTPPVSAQVTVNCALPVAAAAPAIPAPQVQAPRTGTGIIPPNTGDAGLVGSSSGANWTLFAFGGLVALTLAGLATVKLARR